MRRGSAGFSSSSVIPFLKLLMPLATSPIMSEKRPLPNNSKMMTPTTSQCPRLRPPISILRLRLRTYLVLLALRFQFQLAHLFQRGINGLVETCPLEIVAPGPVAAGSEERGLG